VRSGQLEERSRRFSFPAEKLHRITAALAAATAALLLIVVLFQYLTVESFA
jgi:hypothetical protein